MKDAPKRVVLIDDDESTNYLNKLIIGRSKLVDEVIAFDSGESALDFFTKEDSPSNFLVLLDVNMPVMDGWQFLEEYKAQGNEKQLNQIIMLSSSINPMDRNRAEKSDIVVDYRSKPLTIEVVNELILSYLN